jgi:hypothetical protein
LNSCVAGAHTCRCSCFGRKLFCAGRAHAHGALVIGRYRADLGNKALRRRCVAVNLCAAIVSKYKLRAGDLVASLTP